MNPAYHTVHVRVNDAATGQPTPVRIRFVGSSAEYLAPYGRLTEFPLGSNQDVGGNLQLGEEKFAYIDGTCEIGLPAQPVTVTISKGPEFTPIQRQVNLGPGKMSLRFNLERWIDLRKEGWYSGDTNACFLTPHAAMLEGAAEDLAVVNLLALEVPANYQNLSWDPEAEARLGFQSMPNLLAFSGQRPALETPGHMVVVNTLNEHLVLGCLALLNCHRVVYPLAFGGPNGTENWTLADWCDQCHRKAGLVVWAAAMWKGPFKEEQSFPSEALADLILGKVDALEINSMMGWPEPNLFNAWYELLKCGLHVPLVGGSNKTCNGVPLGCARTYARVQPGEEFSYKNWIEAIRSGRTFVTNGPLLTFTVADQDPGAVLDLPAAVRIIHLRAEARSLVPFEKLEVVHNGSVVLSTEPRGLLTSASLETDLKVSSGGWLAARCEGSQVLPGYFGGQRVYAHTSPVYLQVEGKPPRADPNSVATLIGHLDKMLGWVQREGRFENDRQRDNLTNIFHAAREKLHGRATRGVTVSQP